MWATHEFIMQLDRERLCIVCNDIGCCCVNKYPLHDIVCKNTDCDCVCRMLYHSSSFGQQEADAEKAAQASGEQKGSQENQVVVDDRSHCRWNLVLFLLLYVPLLSIAFLLH